MRISTSSCLLAALCASGVHATNLLPTKTATSLPVHALDDLTPRATPFPGITHDLSPPHLDIRQNLGVDQNAGASPNQVAPVTVYSIVSQVGATGVAETYTYTQTFAAVPDQFPVAKRGTVGYGTLQRKRMAEAEPTPAPILNTGSFLQPLVLAMETVLVTRHLRRVTDIIVIETRTAGNGSTGANSTAPALNNTLPASLATGVSPGLYTASASRYPPS